MMGNKKLKRVLGRALSAFLVMTLTFEGAFVTSGATEALEASETEETLTSEASEAVSDDLVVDDSETVINVDCLEKENEKKVICKDKTVEITLGENASYEKEELDELFKAVFDYEDTFDTDSLKVEYSFFTGESSVYERAFDYLKERLSGSTDEEDASGLEAELFDSLMDAESEKLSEIEAGSDVLAVIKATDPEDKTVLYLVKAKVTSDAATEGSSEDEAALDASSEASSEDDASAEDSSSDGSSLEEDSEEEVAGFTIKASDIMYGESGDNKDGSLDALFAPSYVIDGEKAESFETEYKFVTDKESIGEITAETFDDIEGVSLETIPAGTEVMAVCKATIEDQPDAVAVDTFTVEKRKLRLCFEAPKESAINEKSELLDDKLVIGKDEAAGCVTIEVLESELSPEGVSTFAATEDEIDPAKVLGSDVVLDVSEVDYENIGYQEVPVTMELSEDMSENFEIVEELVGYVYVEETTYTITFTAMNNGETKELKYELDQSFLSEGKTVKAVLDRLGVYSDVYPSMGGFVDVSKGEEIARWMIAKDAMSTSYSGERLPADFIEEESDEGNYLIFDKSDYYVSAFIRKKASDNIYVEVNPTVVYNGMNHVSQFASRNTKQENDLDLTVSYHADEDLPGYELYLRYGKDYKVTYKNNKNASVTMSENGEYEPLYVAGTDDAKRPCAMVTGIGSYKGFSATVYFDILPSNIGADTVAEVSGLKKSYVLNSKGKISAKISPKVTLTKWYYYKKSVKKVQTLKLGKDYVPKLYVYEEGIWKECADSNPSRITQEGRYLYTVRGIGNYCGTAFGQGWCDEPFNDGRSGEIFPAVCSYVGTDVAKCQFIVIGDASQDLANATVTVKKTKLNYKYKKYYTGADFGIKVTIGKGADKRVLTEGQDYYVTYDGNDFQYISGRDKNGVYNLGKSSEIYSGGKDNIAGITIANNYKVKITAIEGNENGIFGSKNTKSVKIKGIKINPGWFKLNSPSLKYNGRDDSSAFRYVYSYKSKVRVVQPTQVMRFDSSNGASNYDAVKGTMTSNAVFVGHSAYNKNPGEYTFHVLPLGPGVDHTYVAEVKFKRTGISTKEAFKRGILKISYDAADYNAGGALPKNIVVTLNGYKNNLGDMHYNGQTFYVNDTPGNNVTSVKLKLTVSNNKKTGNSAALYVQGDGKVFKGKSGKFTFSVKGIDISNYAIPVLHADDYIKSYGKTTGYVRGGTIYAKYTPVAKPKNGLPKYKIDLYQAYCKSAADWDPDNPKLSLAKLSASQYKLTLTADGSNKYKVAVGNKKAKIITGYNFEKVTIAEDYTVYDKTATIVGATAVINGEEYNFPADSAKPVQFTGSQIRFDKKPGDGVNKIKLKDGTELTPESFYVEYGNNVATGKKSGSFTVILKIDDEGAYTNGGKATFRFTISSAGKVTF